MTNYLLVKFVHIAFAVIGLGTSAALGIALEFYGNDTVHGSFVQRVIERGLTFVVFPGYLLVLATGLWMMQLGWAITTPWIQLAMVLWTAGLVLLVVSLIVGRKQLRLFEAGDRDTTRYRRLMLLSRVLGGAFGLVILSILYVMVFKPSR
jgi:uncharacterized membrane protein